jgi:hypothetical protein
VNLNQTMRVSLAALCLVATAAQAEVLAVKSYDMINGNGQASGGSYNYWDAAYSVGGSNTTTDNAALIGGLGDLTDGVVTSLNWNDSENTAGTGPYVGWRNLAQTAGPIVTFNFVSNVSISSIRIHADDSAGYGGVSLPSFVSFNGGAPITVVDPDASSSPSWLEFSNLNLSGTSVKVQFGYGNQWVFVDEVQFIGAVPEPKTYAMLLAGLGMLSAVARKTRRS